MTTYNWRTIEFEAISGAHAPNRKYKLELNPLREGEWDIDLFAPVDSDGNRDDVAIDWILDFQGTEGEAIDCAEAQLDIEVDESTRKETP